MKRAMTVDRITAGFAARLIRRSRNRSGAALATIGRTRRVALVPPSFASNVTSLAGTELPMSIPSRLADSSADENLVRFEPPLTVPACPYSIIWHWRTDADPACLWLRSMVQNAHHKNPRSQT